EARNAVDTIRRVARDVRPGRTAAQEQIHRGHHPAGAGSPGTEGQVEVREVVVDGPVRTRVRPFLITLGERGGEVRAVHADTDRRRCPESGLGAEDGPEPSLVPFVV